MQERVSFTPPEIKLFEGKTPPTSWFNENIVRYYEVKSHSEFLTGFHQYVKQLQGEKIAKAIPHAVEKEPMPAPLPEKALPQDIAKILMFNALQPLVKSQIENLEKLIVILKESNPNLSKELNQLLAQIKTVAKGYPMLSEEQLNFLSKTSARLDEYASRLPLYAQRKYWDKQFSMLYEMWESMEQFLKNAKSGVNESKTTQNALEEMQNNIKALASLLQAKAGRPFTKEEVQQLLAFLQSAADNWENLSKKEKQSLGGFLQRLAQVKSTGGSSLTGLSSDFILKQWIEAFLKKNPNASSADLKKYVQNLLDESGFSKTSLPFLSEMGDSIDDLTNTDKFPFVKGKSGILLASEENGKLVLNKNFDHDLASQFILDGRTTQEAIQSSGEANQQIKNAADRYQKIHEGFSEGLSMGEGMKASFGSSAATAAGNSAFSGSLPNEFRDAILNHYMPQQETYLMQLAELLFFANFGAEMGNALLDKMLDFGEAANNYDFSNFLHKDSTGNYAGSYTTAKNELSNERTQCSTDINKCQSALNYIKSEEQRIQNNSQLTQTQKNQLISQLNKYAANLHAALNQLKSLQGVLKGLQVHSIKGDSQHFTISGDVSDLSKDENLVINGNPKPPLGGASGGLLNIQSMVQADQQSYSDQSQNQQMMLQMRMTEIQQEWTLVSQALQTLNQSYMTCAQSIYK